jgi:uncharacterized DUF497 family protein
MALTFEWDPGKAERNDSKHVVSFLEAASVFHDARSLTIPDPDHSAAEERWILVGASFAGRLLVVVHTHRSPNLRIISARLANRRERKAYEKL